MYHSKPYMNKHTVRFFFALETAVCKRPCEAWGKAGGPLEARDFMEGLGPGWEVVRGPGGP